MKHFGVFPLVISLLLGSQGIKGYSNNEPCQKSRCNNCHNQFLHKHVRPGTPTTTDRNAWEKYLRENNDCKRPTQSFLNPNDRERVDAVCSSSGGKTYKGNLCISRSPFKFLTVRSDPGTCGVSSVREETKHLILACEALENRCVPVHFEGNREGSKPDNNAPGCGSTHSKDSTPSGKAVSWRESGMWLMAFLFLSFLF
ncbi:angiogenin [Esox lucius]|uniref:angiogenin n=1 Tax=Esox lucius TaxID=8010 RepID=UPI001476FC44|nr:angiogenin [Esox lucius]